MKNEIKDLAQKIYLCLRHISKFRALYLAVLKTRLLASLKNGTCFFAYNKPKEETRYTLATLDPQLLPPYEFKTSGKEKPASLLTVWDTEKYMWRTFRIDRVKIMYV